MVKQIKAIKLKRLLVPARREFLHSVNEAVEAYTTVKEHMPMVYPGWRAAYDNMVRVYEISLKSEDTALILNLEDRRDNVHTAVKAAANNFRKAMDDETRRHGTAVWDALNSFRVDINAQYNIQTAQLDSLLGVLLGEQLRPSIEALGLLPMVQTLKDLNDRLHELVTQRDIENIGKPDGQRKEALDKAIAAYRALVQFVNAYYLINVEAAEQPNAELSQFIDLLNTVIRRYRRTYGQSGSSDSASNGDEDEDSDDEDETDDNGNDGGNDDNNNNNNGGGTLTPDENPPGQNPNPTPGEGNGENEDEYTPPDNDGGFGKAKP